MKIVRPHASIRDYSEEAMSKIEWCARISHRSEEAMKDDSWRRFLKAVVIDHGDWSVVEHVSVSVDFLVDRGITHEIVRHRLFSFTQESTRFVNYEKKMPPSFIYPKTEVECPRCLSGDVVRLYSEDIESGFYHPDPQPMNANAMCSCAYDEDWLSSIYMAEKSYKKLLENGWRPQEARSVFPNALASRLIMTGNLRNWRHFLIMRTSAEAHPQMRQVTIPLLEEFQDSFPILFDDIVPNEKQSIAIKKAR